MAGIYSAAPALIILACYSAASLSQPQPVELFVPRHSSEQSASARYSGLLPEIKELPWNVLVQSGVNVCSGMIIHKDWVLILQSCQLKDANALGITVSAGGETPETATQVLNAKIYQTTDLLEGVTLLHLNQSLVFGTKVRSARIPCSPIGNINNLVGFAAGFANESNTVQLDGYYTKVFTNLCSNSENLCALGDDWPPSDVNLAGVDFLGVPYMYAEDTRECMLGVRKSYIGNNFTSYYPLLNILPTIQKELGLTVKPLPPADPSVVQALCGMLQ